MSCFDGVKASILVFFRKHFWSKFSSKNKYQPIKNTPKINLKATQLKPSKSFNSTNEINNNTIQSYDVKELERPRNNEENITHQVNNSVYFPADYSSPQQNKYQSNNTPKKIQSATKKTPNKIPTVKNTTPKQVLIAQNHRKPSNKIGDYLVKNDLFKMEFDFPTPRPHFIILFTNKNVHKNTLKDLNKNDIESIINLVQTFISTYQLETEIITLSFHTGYWATSSHFHCHVCTSNEVYLRIFYQHLGSISIDKFMPTKNWKIKKKDINQSISEFYVENLMFYRQSNSETCLRYQKKEIESIRKIDNKHVKQVSDRLLSNRLFEIKFDSIEPKIKFEAKSNLTLEKGYIFYQAIETMKRFALEMAYFEKYSGAHICLKFNGPYSNAFFVRVSGDEFFKITPNRDIFFENFKNIKNYYIDT